LGRGFDLTPEEMKACMGLISEERRGLDEEFEPGGDGYNIGANVGPAAGQGISMSILRLFPVTRVMSEIPRGGVCHLIPGRGHYTR
jgi:hypothetical protein